jgi:hypothetical protein
MGGGRMSSTRRHRAGDARGTRGLADSRADRAGFPSSIQSTCVTVYRREAAAEASDATPRRARFLPGTSRGARMPLERSMVQPTALTKQSSGTCATAGVAAAQNRLA